MLKFFVYLKIVVVEEYKRYYRVNISLNKISGFKFYMKFSVVIPVAPWREAEVVESLKNIDYPKNKFEIIVEKGDSPSKNRNRGAKRAKGEIIAFLDDDAILDKNWLKKAESFFNNYHYIDVVGGPQLTPKDDKPFAKISGYALCSLFGGFGIKNRYMRGELNLTADETSLTSANLFCKKQVLKEVKFDSALFPGEDPDFISKVRKKEFKVAYSPDIIIHHRRRGNVFQFIKQMFNYGKVRLIGRNFIEAIRKPFFIIPSLFLLYLIGLFFINFSFLFFIPLIAYFILLFLSSIFIACKNIEPLALFLLLFIFPIIHIFYGAGVIYSIFRKILL